MRKIAILGSSGAGKSTLAKELGRLLNLPIYHLDTYFWKPGWVESTDEEFDAFVNSVATKDKWVIDGNYSRTVDIRLEQADMIIYLDMPRYLNMYRIFKRRIMYHNKTRPDMKEGCQEKLDWEFISWVWNFNKRSRQKLIKKVNVFSKNKLVITLKSPSEVKGFLEDIKVHREEIMNEYNI